jgi:hypothetical protein
LVRQAAYIAKKNPRLVSPYELMIIAIGLEEIDDAPEAERWFRRAVAEASNEFDKVIVRRQYGRALFRSGQAADARKQYQAAADVLQGRSDRHLVYRGDTFERWGGMEADYGSKIETARLFFLAGTEYREIRADWMRRRQLERLTELASTLGVGTVPHDIEFSQPQDELPKD